jgi:S1-C subfamily serine protease
MSERETLTKPELARKENGATDLATSSPFDAKALFDQHQKSIVRVSEKISFMGNTLDNTVGSGFAIDFLPGIATDGSKNSEKDACRYATDNHVVAHTSKDATVELGNGNKYPFTVELRDEANDLAIVRVEKVKKDDCHPLEITDQEKPMQKDDPVVKMGARNGSPGFTEGTVETYFTREEAHGLALLPGEDKKRSMLSVLTKSNLSQGGDSGGPMLDATGKTIAVMDAEGPHVMAGTPAHLLLKHLQKLKATD